MKCLRRERPEKGGRWSGWLEMSPPGEHGTGVRKLAAWKGLNDGHDPFPVRLKDGKIVWQYQGTPDSHEIRKIYQRYYDYDLLWQELQLAEYEQQKSRTVSK